jgi:hypothetical protein
VRGEVIGDEMDFLTLRLIGDEVRAKGYELSRGVALSGFAQHFASAGVESRIR